MTVRLTFLGKSSDQGDSPTLYATDRDTYLVQGYLVPDQAAVTTEPLGQGEILVEVYARLFEFLAEDEVSGTITTVQPPIVHVRANGNYILRGLRLDDDAARFRLSVPDNEDVIDVPKAAIVALLGSPACV